MFRPVYNFIGYPMRHSASFYPLLVSFCLQITYRKVRNLWIGINKLDVPAVSKLYNWINRFTSIFVTTVALLCQQVIVNKQK